jgi:transposase
MSKTFRPWQIDEPLLFPPGVQDFIGEGHLARFVAGLVLEHLDLREIEGAYGSERGRPSFDPAMMTALLLYAYCNGVYSSRRIAKAARERVDFMSIVGLDAPDFRTISNFRKRHLKALAGLFGQVLNLCERAGLARLGHVGLDGTKIKANASKHKAMSYERMAKRAAELDAEVARGMSAAEASDATEMKSQQLRQTFYANFTHQAGTWTRPRRVVAKVEWHPGELYPRVGFIVTNMARPAANVVAFYNKRGTCEQWIKEGKGAIRWTRLSCRSFAANAVRLQLHALAYNLGNFLRARHARADQRRVADEPQGETHQDWREGREPRALSRVPNG